MSEQSGQGMFGGMPRRLYAASPSRLLAFVDCPRRYRLQYLDRPKPAAAPQRAHTSLGIAVHNALRDWWEVPVGEWSAARAADLVRISWVDTGFRDAAMSRRWLERSQQHVVAYLRGLSPHNRPVGVERTVSMRTPTMTVRGRVDRLDDRPTEAGGRALVVVDYKTSRRPSTEEELRTSLPMALYAVAVGAMFRRPCVDVELHHVPSGTVVRHRHTPSSLDRKVAEAESIAADLRRVDADFAERGVESTLFPPRVSPLCGWCDVRAHCPEGQAHAPEKAPWAALEPDA
ncbi:RecB family exonuclease [Arsenicicoccus dermatophilus]|uniref:RecB family exonuclease n=1 Tax=Arsenicicoccus dermatophilus TaxID=1076331 RepID=UPI00391742A7